MLLDALAASILVALTSLSGALFFGGSGVVQRTERWLIPATVGVFLSLALYELIPETLLTAPELGGIAVAVGFISFYILSATLHSYFHKRMSEEDCDKKSAANLILIGDAIHNLADGVVLGGAFLVAPEAGIAVAVGLALHEIPQEIVEFGILVRAGYSRVGAAIRNLISASSIILGTFLILLVAEHAEDYVWVLTGIAAGNLLYLAASDLLPRIHGESKAHGGSKVRTVVSAMIVGFLLMTAVITWTHNEFGHGHEHHDHTEEAAHDHEIDEHEHTEEEHHEEEQLHEEPE